MWRPELIPINLSPASRKSILHADDWTEAATEQETRLASHDLTMAFFLFAIRTPISDSFSPVAGPSTRRGLMIWQGKGWPMLETTREPLISSVRLLVLYTVRLFFCQLPLVGIRPSCTSIMAKGQMRDLPPPRAHWSAVPSGAAQHPRFSNNGLQIQ